MTWEPRYHQSRGMIMTRAFIHPRSPSPATTMLAGIALVALATLAMPPEVARAQAQAAPRSRAATSAVTSALRALNRQFRTLTQQISHRTALLGRLARYRRAIAATRRRPAGPARDFKLRGLLAEARDLAARISRVDRTVRALGHAVDRARVRLGKRLDALSAAERARARAALSRTRRAHRAPRVLRVARPRIHPLDGPRQIEEKADLLRDSAEKVRRRLVEIQRIISRIRTRQRLREISRRVDRYTGLFAEDTTRHRVTRIRPSRPAASTNDTQPAGVPRDGDRGSALGGSYNGPGESGTVGLQSGSDPSRDAPSGTYAVVLREVLTPGAVQALKRAGLRRNPGARLRALERARQELARTAKRLRDRARAYRARARTLRTRQGHATHR